MNIAQLRHLIALAETGSFTHAARSVNRSQPAFSRSISELEIDLGTALVDRIGHSNELTFIGRAVLAHARHVVFEADELARSVREHLQGEAGHHRIGLGSTPSALLMGPLLTYAATSKPPRKITLSKGPIEQQVIALRERRLDALLVDMRAVNPTPDLQIEQFASLQTGLLARPQHPLLSMPTPVSFADISMYPVACTPISDEVARLMVSAFGPDAHPNQLVTLCSDDIHSMLEASSQSDALFLGVVATGQAFIRRGKLERIPFATPGLDTQFALVRLNRQLETASFAPIRQLMKRLLKDAD